MISASCLLTSCGDDDIVLEKSTCNKVTINMTNDTGSDIIDFSINNTTWDNLENGTTIENICVDELLIDYEFPILYFSGTMDGDDVKSIAYLHWCGVGLYTENEGVYNIEIKVRTDWNEEYLTYEYIVE